MTTRLDEVTALALELPLRDRVILAQRLTSGVNPGPESTLQIDETWFELAEKRARELSSGEVQAVDSDVVFAQARKDLGR
ncbi:MAG: hypothetical protein AMXMBFR84_39310 [Candidatus Hydrogenedentota bacterium]